MGKQILNGVLYGTGEIIKFSPYIYSLEEREVGVWIDGKPLYQRTWEYRVTSTISGGEHSLINFPNVNIIKLEAECFAPSSRACYPLPYTTADSYRRVTGIKYNNDYIKLDVYDDTWGTGYTILITAYYTKTTDTPGSGHYTTRGGEAHHYSTSEQIVGTWIDGKPLYEKTYHYTGTLYSGGWVTLDSSRLPSSTPYFSVMNVCFISTEISSSAKMSGHITRIPFDIAISNGEQLYLENKSNYKIYEFIVTIQYTKTTD